MFKQDREQAFAKTALALMGGAGVITTPENFELFYAYASGENPAIAQVMGAMIAARSPSRPNAAGPADALPVQRPRRPRDGQSRHRHDDVIDDVLGKLEAAGREAADYTNTLSAATGELGGDGRPPICASWWTA